jgi:hypothetical protein
VAKIWRRNSFLYLGRKTLFSFIECKTRRKISRVLMAITTVECGEMTNKIIDLDKIIEI